jgi:hypothetical protein
MASHNPIKVEPLTASLLTELAAVHAAAANLKDSLAELGEEFTKAMKLVDSAGKGVAGTDAFKGNKAAQGAIKHLLEGVSGLLEVGKHDVGVAQKAIATSDLPPSAEDIAALAGGSKNKKRK